MTDTYPCPACQKPLVPKAIPKHTNGCPKWQAVIGVPPSQFNFDRHFKRGLYADGLQAGVDFAQCRLCDFRAKRLLDHLKNVHKLDEAGYVKAYPGAPVRLASTLQARVATVQQRYGVDNVFQTDEVKAKSAQTAQELYGVDHAARAPQVIAKRERTNLARYGVANPFDSPAVQAKGSATMLARWGATSPQQVPLIRLRTLATCLTRYGAENAFVTAGFRERFKAISKARWGTDHPMQSAEGRQAFEAGCLQALGYPSPFHSPSVQARTYATNLANHGGQHSQKDPDVLAKARATWMEKYGEDNPAKVEAVKQRVKDVWVGKYGVPFPPQSLWTNRDKCFPNKLEQTVQSWCPVNVVYAGDGTYWVRNRSTSRSRNPDFIVLNAAQIGAYQIGSNLSDFRIEQVVEVFGDYWHGPEKTGKDRAVHQAEVEAFYAAAQIDCLVLWEGEIRRSPQETATRLSAFLGLGPL